MNRQAQFKVRSARRSDSAPLAALFRRFYREERFPSSAVAMVARTIPAVLRRRDTAAFVAVADGAIVGAAAMSTAYGLEVGLYAELEDIYVLPEWRGRGVASGLVEACLAWATRRGCHDVEIVLTRHAQAKKSLAAWYAKRGFESSGRVIWYRELPKRKRRR
jgi:GNAT superfamily N-acetyltransferase